jgi:spore coat polysaccharide biosynthesis predicted glycosyltransferase SpsG
MSDGPVVTVLAEAGRGVGLGHLRRCQALVAALATAGANTALFVSGAGWEPAPATALDWIDDASAVTTAVRRRPDAVVVDSYRASESLLRDLRAQAPCVVAIDDLADRALPVSIVVNGSWHATSLAYRTDADTVRLVGPRYALLDPAFGVPPSRRIGDTVRRVLVSFGGDADTTPLLVSAVETVRRVLPRAAIDVATVVRTPLMADSAVTVHHGLPSLRALIASADLVVSGGGMTLYECLASGAPVVATVLADNQKPNVSEMARAGLIVAAEPSLEAAVARVSGDVALRRSLAARGREAVDGGGATRVAAAIIEACRAAGVAR